MAEKEIGKLNVSFGASIGTLKSDLEKIKATIRDQLKDALVLKIDTGNLTGSMDTLANAIKNSSGDINKSLQSIASTTQSVVTSIQNTTKSLASGVSKDFTAAGDSALIATNKSSKKVKANLQSVAEDTKKSIKEMSKPIVPKTTNKPSVVGLSDKDQKAFDNANKRLQKNKQSRNDILKKYNKDEKGLVKLSAMSAEDRKSITELDDKIDREQSKVTKLGNKGVKQRLETGKQRVREKEAIEKPPKVDPKLQEYNNEIKAIEKKQIKDLAALDAKKSGYVNKAQATENKSTKTRYRNKIKTIDEEKRAIKAANEEQIKTINENRQKLLDKPPKDELKEKSQQIEQVTKDATASPQQMYFQQIQTTAQEVYKNIHNFAKQTYDGITQLAQASSNAQREALKGIQPVQTIDQQKTKTQKVTQTKPKKSAETLAQDSIVPKESTKPIPLIIDKAGFLTQIESIIQETKAKFASTSVNLKVNSEGGGLGTQASDTKASTMEQIESTQKLSDSMKTYVENNSHGTKTVTSNMNLMADGSVKAHMKIMDANKMGIMGLLDFQAMAQKIVHYITFSVGVQMVMMFRTAMQSIVTSIIDFEKASYETASVAGYLGASFSKAVEAIQELSKEIGENTVFSANTAAKALYNLASAGVDVVKSEFEDLIPIINYAAATNSELDTAFQAVTKAMRQFNLETEETEKLVDSFMGTITSSYATLDKLVESYKYVGSIAGELGQDFNELNATLGVLYDRGLEAGQAGQRLNMIYTKLLKPTDDSIEILDRMGLTLSDINPYAHSLVDIMYKLRAAHFDAGDAATFFRARTAAAALILMDEVDKIARFRNQLELTKGLTESIAEKQLTTMNSQLRLMANQFEEAALSLSNGLIPVIHGFATIIKTEVVPATESLYSGIGTFVELTSSMGGVLKIITSSALKVIPTFFALNIALYLTGVSLRKLGYNAGVATLGLSNLKTTLSGTLSSLLLFTFPLVLLGDTFGELKTPISILIGGLTALTILSRIYNTAMMNQHKSLLSLIVAKLKLGIATKAEIATTRFGAQIDVVATRQKLLKARAAEIVAASIASESAANLINEAIIDEGINAEKYSIAVRNLSTQTVNTQSGALIVNSAGKETNTIITYKNTLANIANSISQKVSAAATLYNAQTMKIAVAAINTLHYAYKSMFTIKTSYEKLLIREGVLTTRIAGIKNVLSMVTRRLNIESMKELALRLRSMVSLKTLKSLTNMHTLSTIKNTIATKLSSASLYNLYFSLMTLPARFASASAGAMTASASFLTAAGAAKVLSAAIAATGVGLIIVALGWLAGNWDTVSKSIMDAATSIRVWLGLQEKEKSLNSEQADNLKEYSKLVDFTIELERERSEVIKDISTSQAEGIATTDKYIQSMERLSNVENRVNDNRTSLLNTGQEIVSWIKTQGEVVDESVTSFITLREAEYEYNDNKERQNTLIDESKKALSEYIIAQNRFGINSEQASQALENYETMNRQLIDTQKESQGLLDTMTEKEAEHNLSLGKLNEIELERVNIAKTVLDINQQIVDQQEELAKLRAREAYLINIGANWNEILEATTKNLWEQQLKLLESEEKLYKLRKEQPTRLDELFQALAKYGLVNKEIINGYKDMKVSEGELTKSRIAYFNVIDDLSDDERKTVEETIELYKSLREQGFDSTTAFQKSFKNLGNSVNSLDMSEIEILADFAEAEYTFNINTEGFKDIVEPIVEAMESFETLPADLMAAWSNVVSLPLETKVEFDKQGDIKKDIYEIYQDIIPIFTSLWDENAVTLNFPGFKEPDLSIFKNVDLDELMRTLLAGASPNDLLIEAGVQIDEKALSKIEELRVIISDLDKKGLHDAQIIDLVVEGADQVWNSQKSFIKLKEDIPALNAVVDTFGGDLEFLNSLFGTSYDSVNDFSNVQLIAASTIAALAEQFGIVITKGQTLNDILLDPRMEGVNYTQAEFLEAINLAASKLQGSTTLSEINNEIMKLTKSLSGEDGLIAALDDLITKLNELAEPKKEKGLLDLINEGVSGFSNWAASWLPGIFAPVQGGVHAKGVIALKRGAPIVDRPQQAIIGEDGAEAVVPLEGSNRKYGKAILQETIPKYFPDLMLMNRGGLAGNSIVPKYYLGMNSNQNVRTPYDNQSKEVMVNEYNFYGGINVTEAENAEEMVDKFLDILESRRRVNI